MARSGTSEARISKLVMARMNEDAGARAAILNRRIKTGQKQLRQTIAGDPQLKRDLEFFVDLTGWRPDLFLSRLYWDSNIMHAGPQAVVAQAKKESWPIARHTVERIVKHVSRLASEIELIAETHFSPDRTHIFRNGAGAALSPQKAQALREDFAALPETLRRYSHDLRRKLLIEIGYWRRSREPLKVIAEEARSSSIFELLRAAVGQHHAVRLLRLVNAARKVHGFTPIKQRAFVVWLNRLRKRRRVSP
jgi:hypothetical protein